MVSKKKLELKASDKKVTWIVYLLSKAIKNAGKDILPYMYVITIPCLAEPHRLIPQVPVLGKLFPLDDTTVRKAEVIPFTSIKGRTGQLRLVAVFFF